MRARPFVVAIDGPAASGKSTLARRLAAHFGFSLLDTGGLYRATAALVLAEGGDPGDAGTAETAARRVTPAILAELCLDNEKVAAAASKVAAIPSVRQALLDFQRDFAARSQAPSCGAILVGRDIGSVVCPAADLKLFVIAAAETRAERRLKELRADGATVIYETVLQDLKERDIRDSERRVAPLAPAADAVVIDTTEFDPDTVFERAAALLASAQAGDR